MFTDQVNLIKTELKSSRLTYFIDIYTLESVEHMYKLQNF